MQKVDMPTELGTRSGLDPGISVRIQGGEYSGASKNAENILKAVQSVVSLFGSDHIKRILTQGCPFELQFGEDKTHKSIAIKR